MRVDLGDRATSVRQADGGSGAPSHWTAAHVAAISAQDICYAPVIGASDVKPVSDLGLWDAWPVQQAEGRPAQFERGETLWMALAAPRFADPDERHAHARIHLLRRTGEQWERLQAVLPHEFSPGSREWSGSAVLDRDGEWVTLFFTAAGRRGERVLSYEQRLFQARARLRRESGRYRLTDWRDLEETVERDPMHYMATDSAGAPGSIKAFRDPFPFRDPGEDKWSLVFAGSAAGSRSPYNGVIGAAVSADARPSNWRLLPPLVSADALNNELERPHIVRHQDRCYLFWSTQEQVFDPAGPVGPTGLYGMTAAKPSGPWEPLNGTGLVFANPPQAPRQAYGWLVLPDLSVISFVDDWGHPAPTSERRFGGTFAPVLRLRLEGARAAIDRG